MEKLIKEYESYRKQILAFSYVMNIVSWDSSTCAPKGCFQDRSEYLSIISEEQYKLLQSPRYKEVVNSLYDNRHLLNELLSHEIEVQKIENDKLSKIPLPELLEYEKITSISQDIWVKAKNNNDFESFKPYLKKIFEFKKKYCQYLEEDNLKGYDVLLNDFEKGYTTKEYDQLFDLLKEKLVPFVHKVLSKKLQFNDKFLTAYVPVDKQKEVVKYIEKVMEYDLEHGVVMESEHPFTSGFNNTDVRITVHYYENLVLSSMFSALHELGHATYEQQVNDSLNNTFSGGGASMAMHESQSRFYENNIGRSYEFWSKHYPKIQEIYQDYLQDVTLEDFYKGINKVEASYIRTEADELTYPLHIMLRYELERDVINGNIDIDDLEIEWNKRFKEYFGIEVDCAKNGILQDVHWADGLIGYFPTYVLGSSYACQLYHHMSKDLNMDDVLQQNTTKEINKWLKEHIHQYGASMYTKDILHKACGEDFNPNYYIDYLIEKYKKIYEL